MAPVAKHLLQTIDASIISADGADEACLRLIDGVLCEGIAHTTLGVALQDVEIRYIFIIIKNIKNRNNWPEIKKKWLNAKWKRAIRTIFRLCSNKNCYAHLSLIFNLSTLYPPYNAHEWNFMTFLVSKVRSIHQNIRYLKFN